MLNKLILQIVSNAIAIYVASQLVSGFTLSENSFVALLTIGLILGLINFFVKPLLKLISAPVIFFTFGLFTIIINVAMLLLLDYAVDALYIDGFWAAFWAMVVISAVNFFIGSFSKK